MKRGKSSQILKNRLTENIFYIENSVFKTKETQIRAKKEGKCVFKHFHRGGCDFQLFETFCWSAKFFDKNIAIKAIKYMSCKLNTRYFTIKLIIVILYPPPPPYP